MTAEIELLPATTGYSFDIGTWFAWEASDKFCHRVMHELFSQLGQDPLLGVLKRRLHRA